MRSAPVRIEFCQEDFMSKHVRISESVEPRSHRLSAIICLVFALLWVLPGAMHAQILYGALTGNVTDPTGAVLPNARVDALDVATGVVRTTQAEAGGVYYFTELLPGIYKVTFTARGFTTTFVENVRVDVNAVRRVDIKLKVATATQEITVTASALQLQTDRADVHTNLDSQQIQSLPISSSEGRSWQALYNLIPGATPTGEANSQAGNPQRAMNTNVNGGSNQNNNTRIDGAQNAYPWLPANIAYVPPADAVETINVVTNSFDAEQGMAGGMAVNVQIKSGTNKFHGEAYENHTDSLFRAENYFQPQTTTDPVSHQVIPFTKPKDVQNQWGGTFGGPIKKDKLFFFGDFERTTERKFAFKQLTVPTDAMRNGDFSAFLTPPPGNNHNPAPIYDPNTGAANGTGRTQFACNGNLNTICPNRFDPAALALLALIPEPNIPTPANQIAGDYLATGDQQFNRNNFDVKINYIPTEKSMVFGRYSWSNSYILDPPDLGKAGGDALNNGQLGNAFSRIQNIGLGGTYSITPNMLADANFGFTRQRINATALDIGSNFGLDTQHIPGTNGSDPLYGGIPAFFINGIANLGNPNTGNPFLFRDNQWVSNGNLSWNKGRHGLRFGVEFNRSGINHFQPQGGAFQTARGSFNFSGVTTEVSGQPLPASTVPEAFAAFLLGLPNEVGKATQNANPNSLRWTQTAIYARDQWQMLPTLTVTYGLRWERYPFATSDHGGVRLLDPSTMNVLIGGHGNVPLDDGVKIGPGLFLPRLGVAWRPLSNTVVRAGYGMSSDPNNWRFFRNAFPAVTISDFRGVSNQSLAPAASLTGTNCGPTPTTPCPSYGTIPVGITPIPLPDLSSGVVPLPDGTSTTTAAMDFRRGYTHSFNLTIGQEFKGFIADVGYVGSRSIRPLTNININPGPIGGGPQNGRLLNAAFGHISTNINPATGQPYRGWGDINSLIPFGNAYYDSLQAKMMRKFKGVSFVAVSYTFSKAIDFSDNEELNFLLFPFPAYAPKARGLASFDRTHNLRFYGAYELPFGRGQRWFQTGILNQVLGGWQTNWIVSGVSGTPLTITAGDGQFNAAGNTETADVIAPFQFLRNQPMLNCASSANPLSCSYFNPSTFAAPTGPRFGTGGRDILRGPGFFNTDMSLFRTFKLTERFSLQTRAEAFGLTNTPRFGNPGTGLGSSTFGIITSSSGERTIWLAAKLMF
jgi:hypothetical protein